MQQAAQFSKSKVQCLVRHRGGKYYASTKVAGKVIRRSLDTDDFNTAKNRLPAVLAEIRGATNATAAGTLGAAIKETTRHYYQQIAVSVAKASKRLPVDPMGISIARVTLAELRALMDKYATTAAPTRYNGALALLRRTYARAVESGHVGANLPMALKRLRPKKRKHDLPTAADFAKIVEDILGQRKSHFKATAMAVEVLAYTGLRISEAQSLRWKDIRKDHMIVRTAKNDDLRQVPLIPAMQSLVERVRAAEIPTQDPTIRSCSSSPHASP
jgi:integrase